MGQAVFRLAQPQDAARILQIYTPYVLETAVSFEFEPPSLAEFSGRIEAIAAEYPYIVCQVDGQAVGYAYAHRQMERAAYQWNAELSVYLDRAWLRRGLGKALYGALMEILPLQNVRNVYGCVTCPNPNSEALHQAMGFHKLGTYHNTGFKCGAWHDTAWFEKAIGDHDAHPAPFLPIHRVDRAQIEAILARCQRTI